MESDNKRRKIKHSTDEFTFLQDLERLYPNEFKTKSETIPRKYKGEYCCQLFSRIRLGIDKSQTLRTRTVTSGFTSIVKPQKLEMFQDMIDKSVDHLSRLRVLASLFANFIILNRIKENIEIPEPDKDFYTKCLSACSAGSEENYLTREFKIFGLTKLPNPVTNTGKPISVSQQRVYIAGEMATSTSTRMDVHSKTRRIVITKWFLAKKLGDSKGLLHTLREFVINDFNETEESKAKLEAKIAKFGDKFTRSSKEYTDILNFSREELEFTKSTVKLVKKKHSLMIKHLKLMFDKYVRESRKNYDSVIREATALFPGNINRKKYREFIEDKLMELNGTTRTPPKDAAVLPICSSGSVFIRIDMKTLKNWKIEYSNDPWWYSSVINPYSKKANIKCLISKKNSKYSSSKEGYLSSLLSDGPSKCPWMVGTSFLTDGIQVKLGLTTLLSTSKPFSGSSELNNAGYNSLPRANDNIQGLISGGNGVYNIKSVDPYESLPEDTIFMSADPGQAKIINVTSSTSDVWMERDPKQMFDLSSHISEEEYRKYILATKSEEHEVRRKNNTEYGISVDIIGKKQKRTSCLETFLEYCEYWSTECEKIFEETLHRIRRIHRFSRFRKVQSKLAKIADKYMGRLQDKCRVMMFGKASFKPQKGRASAPRKSMIREMASRGVVLMVDEFNTSKQCPGCKMNLTEDKERRIRSCKNFNVESPENSCKLNSVSKEYEMDRDNVGSINIGFRGIGILLKQDWF